MTATRRAHCVHAVDWSFSNWECLDRPRAAVESEALNAMYIRDVAPRIDLSSMLYALLTTHTTSATRSIVPRMPPPMYITISVCWFKSLFEHERRCLSGRYRTQPQGADSQGTS